MLRQLLYQLLPYRSIASPFLILSSIVVPFWLIYRLYRIRAHGHRSSLAREVLLLIVVLYLSGLAVATLAPNHNPRLLAHDTTGIELRPNLASLTCSSPTLPKGSHDRAFCVYNAKGNVLLFFPLGILIPLVWRRNRFWSAMLIAIALSVTIEVLQYFSRAWGSYRSADINDVILNTFGAFLGLGLVSLLLLFRNSTRVVPRP
jgi:glycopeptide antibiotics resistance protein